MNDEVVTKTEVAVKASAKDDALVNAPTVVEKINLLGMSQNSLVKFFASLGEKPFKAKQFVHWVHQRRVLDFSLMTDFSKVLRSKLEEVAILQVPEVITEQKSADGTRKWLFKVDGGSAIEAVYIPERDRHTLCISSQVGCALNCSFCHTGKQGFNRNLTSSEVIAQLWYANNYLHQEGVFTELERGITNVVMMGMGEPLLNFTNVVEALHLMMDDNAYGLSKRRVTVSTSGVVPNIDELAKVCDVALAISLHAPNDTLRNQLVPINKKYPIAELLAACHRYVDAYPQRKHITIEYVMLDGVNDSVIHARELLKVLGNLEVKINLIPFNPFFGVEYKRSSVQAIENFRQILKNAGYVVTVRKTRGDEIAGACGQLAGDVEDRTRRSVKYKAQKQLSLLTLHN